MVEPTDPAATTTGEGAPAPSSAVPSTSTDSDAYRDLETFTAELAHLAGEYIERSLDRQIEVNYKDLTGPAAPTDAVTDADHEVERVLVERIRAAFPEHAILGEEGTQIFPEGFEYAWAIDPIDGTQNFVNGLPFYSCSIAVLRRGEPVAGAIWGASTHRIGAGVYHARAYGPLSFNGQPVGVARPSTGKRLGLGAMPHDEDQHLHPGAASRSQAEQRLPWDRRHVGSGALEAAFVAIGIFESAFNTGPRIWDIAAGALLVEAGGRHVWTPAEDGQGWEPLNAFGTTEDELVTWRRPVLMASDAAYASIVAI